MAETPDMRGKEAGRASPEVIAAAAERRAEAARLAAAGGAAELLGTPGIAPESAWPLISALTADQRSRDEFSALRAARSRETLAKVEEARAPGRLEAAAMAFSDAERDAWRTDVSMDSVFADNAREVFGFLDDGEKDAVRIWASEMGRGIAAARQAAAEARKAGGGADMADRTAALERRYAHVLAGFGDRYEGAVDALAAPGPDWKAGHPGAGRAAETAVSATRAMGAGAALDWLRSLHEAAAGNGRKSDSVLEANRLVLEAVSGELLARLAKAGDEAGLLRLARVCSGREAVPVRYRGLRGPDRTMGQDADLKDLATAGDALRLLLAREGGPLDRLALAGKVPAETWDLPYPSPGACVGAFRACLDRFGNGPDKRPLSLSVLAADGLAAALGSGPDVGTRGFGDLSLSQRMAVLALGRAAAEAGKHPEWGAAEIQRALGAACGPAWEAVMGRVEEAVSGWSAKTPGELELSGDEAGAYALFCDVRGVGAFHFSDATWAVAREGGKIALAVGAGVLAAAAAPVVLPAMGVVALAGASAAAGGLASTAVSQATSSRGWDSLGEAAADTGSELVLNTAFAYGGGSGSAAAAKGLAKSSVLVREGGRAAVSLADAGAGAGAEWGRQRLVLGKDADLASMLEVSAVVASASHAGSRVAEIRSGRGAGEFPAPRAPLGERAQLVMANSRLGPAERVAKAEEYLGPLTTPKREAVLAAHEAGESGTGPYSQADVLAKARVLADAGFTDAERRLLMERGLVGKKMPNLPKGVTVEPTVREGGVLAEVRPDMSRVDVGKIGEYEARLAEARRLSRSADPAVRDAAEAWLAANEETALEHLRARVFLALETNADILAGMPHANISSTAVFSFRKGAGIPDDIDVALVSSSKEDAGALLRAIRTNVEAANAKGGARVEGAKLSLIGGGPGDPEIALAAATEDDVRRLADTGRLRLDYDVAMPGGSRTHINVELFPERDGLGLTNVGFMDSGVVRQDVARADGKGTFEAWSLDPKTTARGYVLNLFSEQGGNSLHGFEQNARIDAGMAIPGEKHIKIKDAQRIASIVECLECEHPGTPVTGAEVAEFIRGALAQFHGLEKKGAYVAKALKEAEGRLGETSQTLRKIDRLKTYFQDGLGFKDTSRSIIDMKNEIARLSIRFEQGDVDNAFFQRARDVVDRLRADYQSNGLPLSNAAVIARGYDGFVAEKRLIQPFLQKIGLDL